MYTARIPEWNGDPTIACVYLEIREGALDLHVFEENNTSAATIALDKANTIALMNALRKGAKALADAEAGEGNA